MIRDLSPASSVAAPSAKSGQGFEPNPLKRTKIEERAVCVAADHYSAAGYHVEIAGNVESFDLRCRLENHEVRVEVKGTRGDGSSVIVTHAEVVNARDADGYRVDLFVVSGICVTVADGEVIATGGTMRILENWSPEEDRLSATVYRYRLPE